ncbi:MAG: hypothetical protein GQ527_08240, partial [Bacteroidales bacterium]|nr:hypothetical protein [Bacteroidales bacterium]
MKTFVKNTIGVILSLSIIILSSSCTKELTQTDPPINDSKTMADLVVDELFDFNTSQTIQLKVTASDLLGLPATKIDLYNGNPNEDATIIRSGITDKQQVFETEITVPSHLESIHIRRTNYDGSI